MHYEGKLAREGTVFDSSYGREAFQFVIGEGQVIKGWDRGIMEMSLGRTNRIYIVKMVLLIVANTVFAIHDLR